MAAGRVVELSVGVGLERFRLDELDRSALAAAGDTQRARSDPAVRHFGAMLDKGALVPAGDGARIGGITTEEWRARSR
ncbi:hypothetical protein [Micromonospora cremea]|uniref:hypothetical protein n=1 Tax=Micromonospora cremea TaxID=709881 RepID=UPI00117BEDE4|nr:hypothetical protein [Micromonospora cremea]